MKVLDLFSGIGGFSIGLEAAGMETVAFCEIEKYPCKVLAKHWPNVPIYNDVRTLTYDKLKADGIDTIDGLVGGFPCQDISVAGNQAGINDETRSGLWSECARLLGEIRPRFAIFENVTALLNGGGGDWFKRVLWDIQQVGYDAEWHCIPASELGAHHHRDRIWIIAYPNGSQLEGKRVSFRMEERYEEPDDNSNRNGKGQEVLANPLLCADLNEIGRKSQEKRSPKSKDREIISGARKSSRASGVVEGSERSSNNGKNRDNVPNTLRQRQPRQGQLKQSIFAEAYENRQTVNAIPGGSPDIWKAEPNVGRVADGIPDRSHRLKSLGNAVVPQIPEVIGLALMRALS